MIKFSKAPLFIAALTVVCAGFTALSASTGGAAPASTQLTPAGQALANGPSLTGNWNVDPMHTSVGFAIRHFGISEVTGRFDSVKGSIVAKAGHPEASSVTFVIQAASIDTNVKMRDDDLRGKNYFGVAQFPTISFRSTRIAATRNGYNALGYLSMHGVTKVVVLPFLLNGPIIDAMGHTRLGVEGFLKLNRLDYGIGKGDVLANGDFAIGKYADITLDLEAVPAKAGAPK